MSEHVHFWTEDRLLRFTCNPFYCINIHPEMCGEHVPSFTEDEWVRTATQVIEDKGVETFLRTLLHVLGGGYLSADEMAMVDVGMTTPEVMEGLRRTLGMD